MNGNQDSATDPLTGQQIPATDSRYSVLSIYYRLLPQYQVEQSKARDYYLTHTWHDWAVNLLMFGTKAPTPQPPLVHSLVLMPNYTLQVKEIPACDIPPTPDPTKETVRVDPTTNQYTIVPLTQAGVGSGGQVVSISSGNTALNVDSVVAYLKSLSPTDLNNLIAKVFAV